MENAKVDNQSTQCPEHCPLDCFVLRLLWAIGTFAVLLLVLATSIHILDRFDIAHRCLDYFKPYATSLPWILMIVFTTLMLCIPSVTKEIKGLLDRVESIWHFKFFPKRDHGISQEATKEVEEEGTDKSKQLSPEGMKDLILRKIVEIRRRKQRLVQLHGEQIQARLVDRNIGINGCNLHFDARYVDGRRLIFAKVFPLSADEVDAYCENFDSLREQSYSEQIVLHLLVYFREDIADKERRNGMAKLLFAVSRLDYVTVFFFSYANDNSVNPVEGI